MKSRLRQSIVSALLLFIGLCMLGVGAKAQEDGGGPAKPLQKGGPAPRLGDGHLDLSGVWFHGLIGKTVEGGLPPGLREYDPNTVDVPHLALGRREGFPNQSVEPNSR